MVDWSKPLEAVHMDGRVKKVIAGKNGTPDASGRYWVGGEPSDCGMKFNVDGTIHKDSLFQNSGWSIRNVEPTLRTSDEALRRMEALVERMAESDARIQVMRPLLDEARAIQALRNPVDPDAAVARRIVNDSPYRLDGLDAELLGPTNQHIYEAVLAGIKAGRKLAVEQ